ncbi:uncharacterized protein LOC141639435 [Silene latifolia]|uniref:uncharacterized protein LOC141639435 n=1 Tax=Silene latifolia TaxID=37657 RepID=UPI003D78A496
MPRSRRSRRKQATSGRVEVAGEEEGPTICLFVEHSFPEEVNSSIYMIRTPLDLSKHDEDQTIVYDSNSKQNITTLTSLQTGSPMHKSAFVNVGSKIYFFGGNTWYVEENTPPSELDTLSRRVQVIDINDPEKKIQSVASMHTPKELPCVFVAYGKIYVIAPNRDCITKLPGYDYTGLFECYDPDTNCWEVLPDPPFFYQWAGTRLLDCATVIGHCVIIGCPYFHAVYNLKKRIWDHLSLPNQSAPYFPFGSLFVQQSQSAFLYHLSGPGVPRLTNSLFGESPYIMVDTAVARFPLPAKVGDKVTNLLLDNRLVSGKEQIMAQATDLDDNKSFTARGFFPRRFFFHLGGCFFCYVVTAPLFDQFDKTQLEPCSRGVFIKFFKEVPAHTDNSKCGSTSNNNNNNNNSETVFRPVASFCYKIKTTFRNFCYEIRCSVIGTVPDSWINSPPKKRQESKLKPVNKEMNSITHDLSRVMRSKGEKCVVGPQEPEKPENGDRETEELKKVLAAREAEISFLKAELAKKNQLLRTRTSKTGVGAEGSS